MSFSAVGTVWDVRSFRQMLAGLPDSALSWARGVTLHHTYSPSLAMRPKGWTIQHMRNLAEYYGGDLGWSRGPHLFTDEDEILGLSPLTERGIHAVSYNAEFIGIEALGDYDAEDPLNGRGRDVWGVTAAATAALLHRMRRSVSEETVKFHRDDPKTAKTCPGKRVSKSWVIGLVNDAMAIERAIATAGDRIEPPAPAPTPDLADREITAAIHKHAAAILALTEPIA